MENSSKIFTDGFRRYLNSTERYFSIFGFNLIPDSVEKKKIPVAAVPFTVYVVADGNAVLILDAFDNNNNNNCYRSKSIGAITTVE